jgi:hypothetical protein
VPNEEAKASPVPATATLEERLADYQRAEQNFMDEISALKASKKQKLTQLSQHYST